MGRSLHVPYVMGRSPHEPLFAYMLNGMLKCVWFCVFNVVPCCCMYLVCVSVVFSLIRNMFV